MYELYQAEWCPYSSFVREQLTERGVDFVVRQVPAAKAERTAMKERTGHDSVPVLVAGERVIAEFEEILAFLEEKHPARADAGAHRQKYADRGEQAERNVILREHGGGG
ncbi:MAG TPA: glutaredoxin family protein [Chloroflexota bacterium]|nr:glutaredoxin family protein [Chloroflexota bacterium]